MAIVLVQRPVLSSRSESRGRTHVCVFGPQGREYSRRAPYEVPFFAPKANARNTDSPVRRRRRGELCASRLSAAAAPAMWRPQRCELCGARQLDAKSIQALGECSACAPKRCLTKLEAETGEW